MNESAGIEKYFVKAKVAEDYIRLFLLRRKVYLFLNLIFPYVIRKKGQMKRFQLTLMMPS